MKLLHSITNYIFCFTAICMSAIAVLNRDGVLEILGWVEVVASILAIFVVIGENDGNKV